MLEKNPKNIDWNRLSLNPNAMCILEKNTDKIDWYALSWNTSIFNINYKFMKERMNIIKEELIMKSMHPSRLERFLEMGGEIDDFQRKQENNLLRTKQIHSIITVV